MPVALPVRWLCVGCRGTRFGRVAAAPPACGWLVGRSHWAAGCAHETLRSRRAAARQTTREAVAPPMPHKGSATAGTGRCTPPPNPHPGTRAAGHRIRTGHSPPESVQTNPRAPTTPQGTLEASVMPSREQLHHGRYLGRPAALPSRRPLPRRPKPANTTRRRASNARCVRPAQPRPGDVCGKGRAPPQARGI
jgi:hypothetical protein